MRYPIMTIYGDNNIEITATIEKNTPDFLSKEIVTGIVLYIEQWNPSISDFSQMSLLFEENTISILKNNNFSPKDTNYLLEKITSIRSEIEEYINEKETDLCQVL